jgi:hypothetical protein
MNMGDARVEMPIDVTVEEPCGYYCQSPNFNIQVFSQGPALSVTNLSQIYDSTPVQIGGKEGLPESRKIGGVGSRGYDIADDLRVCVKQSVRRRIAGAEWPRTGFSQL